MPPPAVPAPLDPPVEPVEGDSLQWTLPVLTGLVGKLGSVVSFEALPAGLGGVYEPGMRRIVIGTNGSVNARAATVVQELAHALVRVDRQDGDPELGYAQEELVVESIAYTVCGGLGLDTSGAAVPYLASWCEQAELETIERTAGLIDRLARRIEQALLHPAPVGDGEAIEFEATS